MENVTDTVFRRFINECGRPDVFFTEFTNVDWLFTNQRKRAIHRLIYTEPERPLVAQVWGLEPENYYRGARLIADLGFDGIDINMGCPAAKIRRKRTCAGLINDPPRASELIKATQEGAGELPVTVKTRLGVDERVTESWTAFLLEHDLPVLTMHARIAKDMSNVPADWEEMHKVVAIRDQMNVDTLIIGNGDVMSFSEIQEKAETYKVDGVMVGRGIFHDPFLFHPERDLTQMSPSERVTLLMKHTRMFHEKWGGKKDFDVLKKFYKIYASGFDGALALRELLMRQRSLEEVVVLLKEQGFAAEAEAACFVPEQHTGNQPTIDQLNNLNKKQIRESYLP